MMRRSTLLPVAALLALAAVPGCKGKDETAGPARQADQHVGGGFEQVDTTKRGVIAAAKFAAAATSKGAAQLLSVDSAEKQVVAGTNYRLNLTLSDGSRWRVTVRRRLDDGMQLVSSRQLPPLVQPEMRVDAKGIQLSEQGKPMRSIVFGRPRTEVLKALSFRGPPKLSINPECGEGPVQFAQWPDGLSLLFQDGKFGGWGLRGKGGGLHTTDALRIGSLVAQIRVAGPEEIAQTSLGTEFTINGVHGVLKGEGETAHIVAMWSGELSCVFR